MTPNTFMDTFTLVRNSLEKGDTRFHEAFPTEKKVAIAFRISHQRCSMKKGLRPATLLKNRIWYRCFPVNFAKFLRTPFLQKTSGRLLLCFMALSDWEFLPQRFKNICYWKIDCGKHYFYRNIVSNFREPQVEQLKQLLHLKKPLTVKFLRLSVQFGLPELISHNSMLF